MTRRQGGIPVLHRRTNDSKAHGLLIRGVVIHTHVTDSDEHPNADAPATQAPLAVYCDVMAYPSIGGQRFLALKNVLVAQNVAGLHRGRIWKPRPAKLDFVDDFDIEGGSNPAQVDGDHVLIAFMNDNLAQPIIIGALPHPGVDLGREGKELGRRMKLLEADGDPDLTRHHGVVWGVDNLGNFSINTNFANDGILDADGKEAVPPVVDTQGNINLNIPLESSLTLNINDMAAPDTPDPKMIYTFQKDKNIIEIKDASGDWQLKIDSGTNTVLIAGKDGAATLTLGDGAVSVAVADHLETLYGTLKTKLDAHDAHVHATAMGPSGGPTPTVAAPAWDSDINSNKMTIPDTT